jgi:hypothetical protein
MSTKPWDTEPVKAEVIKKPPHRPLGSPNKATAKTRDLIQTVVEGSMTRIQEELETLHGKDYITAVVSLLEFVQPKLARIEHQGEDNKFIINIVAPIKQNA